MLKKYAGWKGGQFPPYDTLSRVVLCFQQVYPTSKVTFLEWKRSPKNPNHGTLEECEYFTPGKTIKRVNSEKSFDTLWKRAQLQIDNSDKELRYYEYITHTRNEKEFKDELKKYMNVHNALDKYVYGVIWYFADAGKLKPGHVAQLGVRKQTGKRPNKKADDARKAQLPGYRVSASGKLYYEVRANRSDTPKERGAFEAARKPSKKSKKSKK